MSAAQPLPISPGATLDIGWDWRGWLAAGETITEIAISAVAPLISGAATQAAGVVTVSVTAPAISGAAFGTPLTVRCTITTSAGRVDTRRYALLQTDR